MQTDKKLISRTESAEGRRYVYLYFDFGAFEFLIQEVNVRNGDRKETVTSVAQYPGRSDSEFKEAFVSFLDSTFRAG